MSRPSDVRRGWSAAQLVRRLGVLNALLLLAIALWATTFAVIGLLRIRDHDGRIYDLGIYEQAVWQMARGRTWLSTRGLTVWGHHVQPILYLFAPTSWLGGGPEVLVVVQAAALAVGAWPLSRIVRARTSDARAAFAVGMAYLLYPATTWLAVSLFHPEALVIPLALWAWWLAEQRRWRLVAVLFVLALMCKEEVAVVGALLPLAYAWTQRRAVDRRAVFRKAWAAAGAAVLWLGIATQVIIPRSNPGGGEFYYRYFYGSWGTNAREVFTAILTKPGRVIRTLARSSRLSYLRTVLGPTGGLFVLSVPVALVAAPQLVMNMLTDRPLRVSSHYHAVIVGPLWIATAIGFARVWRRPRLRVPVLIYLTVVSLASSVLYSAAPYSRVAFSVSITAEQRDDLDRALALIPADASVTISMNLGAEVADRELVYPFPIPWRIIDGWGFDRCATLPDPNEVEYVLVDRRDREPTTQSMIDQLMAGDEAPFEPVYSGPTALLLHRVRPDATVLSQAPECAAVAGGDVAPDATSSPPAAESA